MNLTRLQHLHELVRCCAQLEELAGRTESGPGGLVEEACELGIRVGQLFRVVAGGARSPRKHGKGGAWGP